MEVNIVRGLLITPRRHACSIHINTQYQINGSNLQAVDFDYGFLSSSETLIVPLNVQNDHSWQAVYQKNMLFLVFTVHAPLWYL